MIRHVERVGKAITALGLLTDHTHRTTIDGSSIKISVGPSSVKEFLSEEEFMVWLLHMIKKAAEQELEWFKSHHPRAYELEMENGR
jgi:hypothetical protein